MMSSNDPVDHGHRWAAKRRPIVADRELTTAGGKMGARVAAECLLDALKAHGALGPKESDEANRRHEAGTWLRRLHHRCRIARKVTASYETTGGNSDAEMSDVDADALSWNRSCLKETMRELGRYAETVRDVCVYDQPVRGWRGELLEGLDRLAKMRGIE